MTRHEFYNRCAAHDWYFDWSDAMDTRYRASAVEHRELSALAETAGELRSIWEAWKAYAYSGPAFGTPRAPYPEAPSVSTFAGEAPALIPGQLSIEGI